MTVFEQNLYRRYGNHIETLTISTEGNQLFPNEPVKVFIPKNVPAEERIILKAEALVKQKLQENYYLTKEEIM